MAAGLGRIDVRPLLAAVAALGVTLIALLLGPNAFDHSTATGGAEPEKIAPAKSYAQLPLAFEPNAGRYGSGLDYVASSNGGSVALSSHGATLTSETRHGQADPLRLSLAGAATTAPEAIHRLPGIVNDLRGDDPAKWTTDVPTFSRVRYEGVYPGIDLDWHGKAGTLEYDFRLAPGADPANIALDFGGEPFRIAASGELVVGSGSDAIRQAAPVAYQPAATGEREPVASRFAIDDDGRAGFELGAYDTSRRLVIDPQVLDYSTYLGGNDYDDTSDIAVDASGAAYLVGTTSSSDLNTKGEIEGDSAAADAFVSKLNPAGNALVYSTYLGGNDGDVGRGIAVDDVGAAYVVGYTNSTDFNTVGEIEGDSATRDVFVSKLNRAGNALSYSTYLGGNNVDSSNGIAVDAAGAAYVTGFTQSTDFDTVGAIDDEPGGRDAFVSKLNPAGDALAYSTYLGGGDQDDGSAIAVDAAGAAYVTGFTESTDFDVVNQIEGDAAGTDAFVSKLNPAGSALVYSTYLGGDNSDTAQGIAVDETGAAYVTGHTFSSDYNTVGPIEDDSDDPDSADAFVSKLNPAGSGLAYSTYLGGSDEDFGAAIAVDGTGSAYLLGSTFSTDFDVVDQIEGDSAGRDVFVSKLSPGGGSLTYSTYLGGGGDDFPSAIDVDEFDTPYVAGSTDSTDFNTMGPIEGDSEGTDAFIFKIAPPPECAAAIAALEDAEKGLKKAKKKLKKAKKNGSSKDVKKAKAKVKKAEQAVEAAQADADANC